METMDDAGVYRIDDATAIVQSVDFFFPIVNDAETFGRIVAANSLSDIWAMGARAITAMNVLAYPAGPIPPELIQKLLTGANTKLNEAGVALLGGHTMETEHFIYGMSVTGLVKPERVLTNARARVGDNLILTKPLGTGVFSNAHSSDALTYDQYAAFVRSMERLNKYAADVFELVDTSAMTDVTGFGLLGHSLPVAKSADVCLNFCASEVPILPGLFELMKEHNPQGACKCKQFIEGHYTAADSIEPHYITAFTESQTSGGLLAAVSPEDTPRALSMLHEAGDTTSAVVGTVSSRTDKNYIRIER